MKRAHKYALGTTIAVGFSSLLGGLSHLACKYPEGRKMVTAFARNVTKVYASGQTVDFKNVYDNRAYLHNLLGTYPRIFTGEIDLRFNKPANTTTGRENIYEVNNPAGWVSLFTAQQMVDETFQVFFPSVRF